MSINKIKIKISVNPLLPGVAGLRCTVCNATKNELLTCSKVFPV